MLGHRQLSFEDYLEILRKRWWIILIPAVLACAGVYAYSLTLHDQFTSRTLVIVEQQKVPDSYVKPVDEGDIGERLGTMQEQILSRTRLEPIIKKFDLFNASKTNAPMEDLVDALRGSIVITPIKSIVSTRTGDLPGFSISFTGNNPKLAQQVCSEILSMFIEESIRQGTARSADTTDFMKSQLDLAKKALDDQDAKMAQFKRKYLGSLPGNEQTDINMMSAYGSQLDAVTSQLSRAEQDKSYLESLLAQQLSAWQASQKTSVAVGQPRQDVLEKQMADLQNQLVSLKSRYTDDHPDVVKMEDAIAALQKKIDDNRAHAQDQKPETVKAPNVPEPPSIQQLRFQIHNMDALIKEKTREQTRARGQLAMAQGRLSMSPGVEEEYSELTRGYQTALQFYNSLLAKKNDSEMATRLQQAQQGEQFRVMDPPNLPEKPSYPNRQTFAGAGLGFGLALGLGLTLLFEFRDKTLRTENDIEHFLGLPTLAMVPIIVQGKGNQKQAALPSPEAGAKFSETAHV
jgi:protein tyrosine kinase modulator